MTRFLVFLLPILMMTGCAYDNPSQERPPVDPIGQQVQEIMDGIEAMKLQPAHTYFVNIDKSGSIDTGNERAVKGFLNRVSKHFTKPGDEVLVTHTHDGSTDPRNRFSYRLDVPYPVFGHGEPGNERLKKLVQFTAAIKQQKKQILRHIIAEHIKVEGKAPKSEILGSLTHAFRYMGRHSGEDRSYRYLFLSDGIEDSDIRNFRAGTLQEAKGFAVQDVQVLKKRFGVPDGVFENLLEITFQLPREGVLSQDATIQTVPAYWREIFAALGAMVEPEFTGNIS